MLKNLFVWNGSKEANRDIISAHDSRSCKTCRKYSVIRDGETLGKHLTLEEANICVEVLRINRMKGEIVDE